METVKMTNGECIYRKTVDYLSRMALEKDDFGRFSVIWEFHVTENWVEARLAWSCKMWKWASKPDKLSKILWDSSKCCQLSGADSRWTIYALWLLSTWILFALSRLIVVTPTLLLLFMSQNTFKGGLLCRKGQSLIFLKIFLYCVCVFHYNS